MRPIHLVIRCDETIYPRELPPPSRVISEWSMPDLLNHDNFRRTLAMSQSPTTQQQQRQQQQYQQQQQQQHHGRADSRVVSHSGSNPGAAEKCWAVMVFIWLIFTFMSLS